MQMKKKKNKKNIRLTCAKLIFLVLILTINFSLINSALAQLGENPLEGMTPSEVNSLPGLQGNSNTPAPSATPNITTVNPNNASTAASGPYKNQEKIPGAQPTSEFIPYLKSIINFGFAIIGILALFMLIIGAYQYLMAVGSGNASDAKDTITSALLGLILGLTAWIILNTINPDLVNMNPIKQIVGIGGGNVSYSGVETATSAKYGTVAVSGTTKERVNSYSSIIAEAHQKYPDVPEALIKAVIDQESEGRVDAVGPMTKYGQAKGLMQLIPGTASDMGVTDPFNARQNIMGGVRYLDQMIRQYNGDIPKALGAYNAGPGAYNQYLAGKKNLPAETQKYIPEVMGKMPAYATHLM
jgi:hypothetical protein